MSKLVQYFLEEKEKLDKECHAFIEYNKTHSREDTIKYANKIRNDFRYVWTLNPYDNASANEIKNYMMSILLEFKYIVEGRKW